MFHLRSPKCTIYAGPYGLSFELVTLGRTKMKWSWSENGCSLQRVDSITGGDREATEYEVSATVIQGRGPENSHTIPTGTRQVS